MNKFTRLKFVLKLELKELLLVSVLVGTSAGLIASSSAYAQSNSNAVFEEALFLLDTGNQPSSKTKFLEFISAQANPDIKTVQAYYSLAKIEEDSENIEKSISYLNSATNLLEKVNVEGSKKVVMKELLLDKTKKLNQILIFDKNVEEKKKRIYSSLLIKAKLALDNGQDKNANNYLDNLTSFITKENMTYGFDYYLIKALAQSRSYQYKEADNNFKKAKTSLNGALTDSSIGNRADVAKEIDKMIEQNKKLIDVQEQIVSADGFLKANQYKEAANSYYLVWINSSKDEFALIAAKSFALSGQSEKAIKVYEALENKGSPELYIIANKEKKSLISIMQKKNTLAGSKSANIDKMLEQNIMELNKAGKYSEVEEKTSEILGAFMPKEEALWALEQRAIARKKQKMYQLAINDLTIVIISNPYKKENFLLRYDAYLSINDYSRALMDINTVIGLETKPEIKDRLKKLRLEILPKSIFMQYEEFK